MAAAPVSEARRWGKLCLCLLGLRRRPSRGPSKLLAATALGLSLAQGAQAADASAQNLELRVRGVYFDRDFETPANDREQSALGLQLNYDSPYLADVIGLGFSGYSVTQLGASGRNSADVLAVDQDGDFHDSFGKFGQAFVKLRYEDYFALKAGRQLHKSLLLSSTNSRAIPDSFSGVTLEIAPLEGFRLYGALYNEWSSRADAHFRRFRTDRSAEGDIDYLRIAGLSYNQGGFAVNAEYLESHDYLDKYGVSAGYDFKLAEKSLLKLSAGVYYTRDGGELFVTSAENAELDDEDVPGARAGVTRSDNDGEGAYVAADWNLGKWQLGVALARFGGAWIEDNYAGDPGTIPFPTAGVQADFTNRDETVWALKLGYDWAPLVAGLKTTASYKSGSGARNSHVRQLGEADENELELDLRYALPWVKGLSLRYNYLDYDSDKRGRLDGVLEDNTDHRFYIDYSYRFL